MSPARVAIVQFPGVNCEAESLRAVERVGLAGEVFRWTRPAGELREFQAFLLPGGFSWQDRVRAGALAAKDALMDVLSEESERGKPVLGICNGAQILVEAGLVPGGGTVELALARNRMPDRAGYFARWVTTRVEPSPCLFTHGLEPGTLLPLPVAHGEGCFVGAPGRMAALLRAGQAPLRYAGTDGLPARDFPDNPNGSEAAVAAVCNGRGNVLAIMPHPERAQDLAALSRSVTGVWAERRDLVLEGEEDSENASGPGLELFRGLRMHLQGA